MTTTTTMTRVDVPVYVTPAGAAALLSMHVRTFWRLAARPGFPQPVRLSRKLVRWDRDAVLSWMAAESARLAAPGDAVSTEDAARELGVTEGALLLKLDAVGLAGFGTLERGGREYVGRGDLAALAR